MRCKLTAKPGQIESSVDLPHQVILGHRVAKMKLVERLTLVTPDGPSWIDLVAIRLNTTESRFAACLNRLLQQNLPIGDVELLLTVGERSLDHDETADCKLVFR
jgi:hypothetical protein